MAMFIVKPWYRKKDDAIYGAEWAGTSNPSWVRTDAAVGFADPNPYYSGMSTTPSSPFDNILPWSGMRRVTDANAGELVEIPKFYYKWTRDGIKMKLQISMSQFDGSHVSPAHADRGDGVGERDYVYVGRYKCASDYKSKTGVIPQGNNTVTQNRTGMHNLQSNIWQYDYAMYWTILMLYLVEFANWNTATQIAAGGIATSNNALINTGSTDSMPYHTGTMYSSRNTQGGMVQYRYIENLWANGWQFVDGIYIQSNIVYVNNSPSNYASTLTGTQVASNIPGLNWNALTSVFTNSPVTAGLEYAIFTKSVVDGYSQGHYIYTCNKYWNDSGSQSGKSVFIIGAQYAGGTAINTLADCVINEPNRQDAIIGARLIVLPLSQLT